MSLRVRPYGPQTIAASSASQTALNQQAALAALTPAILTLISSTEAVVPHPENTSIAFTCPLPGNKGLEQIPWDLTASGVITTKTTTNITAKLAVGTSLTTGSNTVIAATSTVAQNSTSAPFSIKAELIYDSVSGKLHGTCEFLINNSWTAKAALSGVVTGLTDSGNPVVTFVLHFISSGATSGNPTTISVKNLSVG